jgi:hypothetical protein
VDYATDPRPLGRQSSTQCEAACSKNISIL